MTKHLTPTYDRLKCLFQITTSLNNAGAVDRSFLSIMDVLNAAFPLRSAVLIEVADESLPALVWPPDRAKEDSSQEIVGRAKKSIAAFNDNDLSKFMRLNEPSANGHNDFIAFPLMVKRSVVFGILQFELAGSKTENDIMFGNTVANLLSVAVDRDRHAQRELHLREARLAESARQLRESQGDVESLEDERKLRETFVSTLSHDLRTPLASAKMSAQLIAKKARDLDEARGLAKKVIDNVNRADLMIRDLLDVNRVRAGQKLPLEIEGCHLNLLVQQTLEDLILLFGDRFEVEADDDCHGYWSKKALRRILENLCSNAVKYGFAKEKITVRAKIEDDFLNLAVHNFGVPLSAEEQAKIFEQYRRTKSADSGAKTGWGIGLAIVKALCEAQGGDIGVRSVTGGTQFEVRLPRDARPFQN